MGWVQMCFLGVPEESRLRMQAAFMIFWPVVVPNGDVHCPMPLLFYLQRRIQSQAGLLLRLEMDGYLQKLWVEELCIKRDYLALAKSALGPHWCREAGVGILTGCYPFPAVRVWLENPPSCDQYHQVQANRVVWLQSCPASVRRLGGSSFCTR